MGRTRRCGRTPATTTAHILPETKERLNRLKKYKDEPDHEVWKRALNALRFKQDMIYEQALEEKEIRLLIKFTLEKTAKMHQIFEMVRRDYGEEIYNEIISKYAKDCQQRIIKNG
jgi:hypothetical protein